MPVLLNPFRAPKTLPILHSSNFVPKKVSSCENVNPRLSECRFLFYGTVCLYTWGRYITLQVVKSLEKKLCTSTAATVFAVEQVRYYHIVNQR